MSKIKKTDDTLVSVSINGDELSKNIEEKLFSQPENHDGLHKKIISAKIVKGEMMQVKFCYTAPDGVKYVGQLSPEGLIHSDLKDSMSALVPHLINICEQKEYPVKEKDMGLDAISLKEKFDKYFIEGFAIHGSGDDEAVSVFGNKLLQFGSISLTSPAITCHADYDYINEFFEIIESCKYEASLYIEGKFAAKQQVMDFEQL